MELIVFFFAAALVGMSAYLVCCAVFFGLTSRPLGLALSMAWKLPIVSLLGVPLFGFGGIILPIIVFVTELRKLPGYKPVRDIVSGLVITVACSVLLYFSTVMLAFEILG